jgi:Ca2+/Na+ antiporter
LILPYILGLDIISLPITISLLFFYFIFNKKKKKKKKKTRVEDAEFYFLYIAFQILYVFLPNISVHCALIEYAYI